MDDVNAALLSVNGGKKSDVDTPQITHSHQRLAKGGVNTTLLSING
jgi:hypothetical protein